MPVVSASAIQTESTCVSSGICVSAGTSVPKNLKSLRLRVLRFEGHQSGCLPLRVATGNSANRSNGGAVLSWGHRHQSDQFGCGHRPFSRLILATGTLAGDAGWLSHCCSLARWWNWESGFARPFHSGCCSWSGFPGSRSKPCWQRCVVERIW